MNSSVQIKTPTFRDILSKDCGCLIDSSYHDLVDGLFDELNELREAMLFSKNLDSCHISAQSLDVLLEYVDKIKGMIIDLKRRDVQSINRLFVVVKYVIYIGSMRSKLSQHALEELSDCGFIVNRLIGLSTNSAYTCVVNDQLYRQKAYTRLVNTGCIRSPRHKCKGK